MLRRDLLKLGSAAALGLGTSGPARAADLRGGAAPGALAWDRSLVLIQLGGGNDGLNTVVPYTDPDYHRLRPQLGVPERGVLALGQGLGLNRAMQALEAAWREGDLGIVLGLGHPAPARAHFRDNDIWSGAAPRGDLPSAGWLARILDDARGGAPADLLAHGITLGGDGAHGGGALHGRPLDRLTIDHRVDAVARGTRDHSGLDRTADRVGAACRRAPQLPDFPRTGLGERLQIAAALITAGAICPVYRIVLSGFDHHTDQEAAHPRLLGELADALAAFRRALHAVAGAWERTTVMTWSEFGRRAAENDRGGTDHGTAAPHLVMGGRVAGGFHGAQPDVTRLEGGDLVHTTDFRSLYAAIAEQFWGYRKPFLSDPGIQAIPRVFSAA